MIGIGNTIAAARAAAIWHNESGDLREVILWRDGYVEFDKFPPDS